MTDFQNTSRATHIPELAGQTILVLDDVTDSVTIESMIAEMGAECSIIRVKSTEQALTILRDELTSKAGVPLFSVLLDLSLLQRSPPESLMTLQSDPDLSQITVYVLATSTASGTIAEAGKPQTTVHFLKLVHPTQLESLIRHYPPPAVAPTSCIATLVPKPAASADTIPLDKLLHDLRAPIVNAKGFKQEILEALTELKALTDSPVQSLDAAQLGKIQELCDEDLQPCLSFLFDAVEVLEQRVQEFSNQT